MTRRLRALGDVPGGYSDDLYTGDAGDSALSLQYYRNKVAEFQSVLEAVDRGARAIELALEADGLDDATWSALYDDLDQYESRRVLLRTTAQAINAGAAAINAVGGRFPVLSIPAGLGIVPVLPVAAIAAVATAATLIAWGLAWLSGVNERLRQAQLLEALPEESRAKLAEATLISDNALRTAEASPWGSIASMVKWGAIAVGAFFLIRVIKER